MKIETENSKIKMTITNSDLINLDSEKLWWKSLDDPYITRFIFMANQLGLDKIEIVEINGAFDELRNCKIVEFLLRKACK